MIRKSMLAIGLAALAFTAAAQAQTKMQPPQRAGSASNSEKLFMKDAIQGDLAEVKMGELAQQKGQSDAVKQLGQKLVTDHSANAEKAKQVAQSMGITPPTAPSAKQKADYKRMSKMSGSKFDSAFAQDMIRGHKKNIAQFKREAKKSGPAADFAKQTVPTLEEHLRIAQSLGQQSQTTGSK